MPIGEKEIIATHLQNTGVSRRNFLLLVQNSSRSTNRSIRARWREISPNACHHL